MILMFGMLISWSPWDVVLNGNVSADLVYTAPHSAWSRHQIQEVCGHFYSRHFFYDYLIRLY